MRLARLVDRKIVDRLRRGQSVALTQMVVHPDRAAAAVALAQHRDDVAMSLSRIVEHRERALQAVAEREIDVSTGGERRQRATVRESQLDLPDRRCDRRGARDFQIQRHTTLQRKGRPQRCPKAATAGPNQPNLTTRPSRRYGSFERSTAAPRMITCEILRVFLM